MHLVYQISVTAIDYDVTYEDINFDPYDTCFETEESMDELCREADKQIELIISELPQTMELEIECEDEDELPDLITEAVSDETGWLVNSVDYDIDSVEEALDDDEFEVPWGGTEKREVPWNKY